MKFKRIFAMFLILFMSVLSFAKIEVDEDKTKVIIHYQQSEDKDWDLWVWPKDKGGKEYKFTRNDKFGKVAEITLDQRAEQVGFIVRLPDWSKKDVEQDRFITTKDGFAEVWLKSKDANVYTHNVDRVLVPEINKTKLIVHFQKSEEANWDLWIWPKNLGGKEYKFDDVDTFGLVAEITLEGNHKEVGYIVRTPEWKKDFDQDRFIQIDNGVAEIWVKSKDPKTYYENPDIVPASFDKLNVTLRYNRIDGNYKDWKVLVGDKFFNFEKDEFGAKANIQIQGKDLRFLEYKIVNGKTSDLDTRVVKKFDVTGSANIWVNQDDATSYTTLAKALEKRSIVSAKIDTLNSVTIQTNKPFSLPKKVSAKGKQIEKVVALKGDNLQTDTIQVIFKKNLNIFENFDISLENFGTSKVTLGRVVEDKSFDNKFKYDGDLGAIYSKKQTTFKVWAPTASVVNLLTYNNDKVSKIAMKKDAKGVFIVTLKGDKLGTVYDYEVVVNGKATIAQDPYTKSSTANEGHSVVVNPTILKDNFKAAKNPIIYELHVRDLSSDPNSGIKHVGKFLGLTETGTVTKDGQITGLDYIKSLGVTHVQLLPIYDFSKNSVDETNQFARYNWGYDPVNYNSPEGSYSTNPNDPNSRITELQEVVKTLHKNGLGVIMDVVYNHVFSASDHSFDKIVPGYFFRHDQNGNLTNGTGVGNDVASERHMARKFIIDSLKYWAKTYNLDGFRFDLMGILDIQTMNEVRKELQKINPNIVILGEGWNLGTLPENQRATQLNANKLPGIAFFNDDIRDGVKGNTFGGVGKGFASGAANNEARVMQNIKGGQGIKTYTEANQLIQYVEAHDNLTLWDQLAATNKDESDAIRKMRHELSTSIVLLSQGTPFLHAGQEFARTKQGDENSYKSSDKINMLDWTRAKENSKMVDYFRQIIQIRKDNPVFNLTKYEDINKKLTVIQEKDLIVAYKLDNLVIIHNSNNKEQEVKVANGKYLVLIKDGKANSKGLETINVTDGKVKVGNISTLMLKKL